MVAPGGGGTCMVALFREHVWLLGGDACVVVPGGACVVAAGGGFPKWHAWDTTRYGDTINERAVRISYWNAFLVTDV